LGGLAPNRLKLASGLFNLMRNLGGAIGIAMCGTILALAVLHQSDTRPVCRHRGAHA
jgi:hypothetical protein